jgi:hypothetical protein
VQAGLVDETKVPPATETVAVTLFTALPPVFATLRRHPVVRPFFTVVG